LDGNGLKSKVKGQNQNSLIVVRLSFFEKGETNKVVLVLRCQLEFIPLLESLSRIGGRVQGEEKTEDIFSGKLSWYQVVEVSVCFFLGSSLRSQIVVLKAGRGQHRKYLPYAFTEQGVAMLSSILHSERAIQMNIAIMRAFVEIRKILIRETDLQEQLHQIKDRLGEHDVQLNQIYDALENLLDEHSSQRKWEDRDRIGFR
jgi:hypothetical protein